MTHDPRCIVPLLTIRRSSHGRCGDVLSCHERILGREKCSQGCFCSQAIYERKRRLESNQGLQKSHQGRRMAATFCNGANFRDSKVVKQTPWGWIQMFNRDQRPIFGGERTERMETLADDCATMQVLFASLRAGETREQPLHPRLVSLHLARKSNSATKRGILLKINRSRVAAVMLHLYPVSIFINQLPNPTCRCNEPQAAPVVKEVKKA